MFEYAKGRFVQVNRIVAASVYSKQVGTSETDGKPLTEIRVAIEIDVSQRENNALFAGPFPDEKAALDFIKSIPTNLQK